MARRLESLPRELFDDIVARLGIPALVALLKCNKRLQGCVEPAIYRRRDVQNTAMLHACKNDNDATIRLAVGRYGASASTIEKLTYPESNDSDKEDDAWSVITRMSTLYQALRYPDNGSCRVHAARALLELGARIEPASVSPAQVGGLLNRLISRYAWTKLSVFLEAGFDAWITGVSAVDRILMGAAKASGGAQPPPLNFVHFLLDRGADPNSVHWVEGQKASISPLTAAIFTQSPSMVRLFLERGADIRGPQMPIELKCWPGLAQIPIFAAVQSMAQQRGGRDMVQLCLDCGADINQGAVVKYDGGYYNVTPVLVYLHCVMSWEDDMNDGMLMPADGLAFLLQKGASLEIPHKIPHDISKANLSSAELGTPPRAFNILIDNKFELEQPQRCHHYGRGNWGHENRNLSFLGYREFFRTAALLVRRGNAATQSYVDYLLHEGTTNHADSFLTREASDIWQTFVTLLLDNYIFYNTNHHPEKRQQDLASSVVTDINMDRRPDAELGTTASVSHSDVNIDIDIGVANALNEILSRVILDVGLSISDHSLDHVNPAKIVIEELLRRPGVDINVPFFGSDRTVLHGLCATYRHIEVAYQHWCADHMIEDTKMGVRNKHKWQFLRFLVEKGADPRLAIADAAERKREDVEGGALTLKMVKGWFRDAGDTAVERELVVSRKKKGQGKGKGKKGKKKKGKGKGKGKARTALGALLKPGVTEMMHIEEDYGKGIDFLPETPREFFDSLVAVLEGDQEAFEKHWDKARKYDQYR
ncbi:hypothetical protein SLS62_005181 [Diatrype stigma]|uniref:F-box domain-containing protein n=1 Tax=Diatrype stigma TaxID=117547 RepID=A0AAN9YSQ1_9PEZI